MDYVARIGTGYFFLGSAEGPIKRKSTLKGDKYIHEHRTDEK